MAASEPLRSSNSLVFLAMSQTLMRVPLADAVAKMLPSLARARHAIPLSCASNINGAVDALASKEVKS